MDQQLHHRLGRHHATGQEANLDGVILADGDLQGTRGCCSVHIRSRRCVVDGLVDSSPPVRADPLERLAEDELLGTTRGQENRILQPLDDRHFTRHQHLSGVQEAVGDNEPRVSAPVGQRSCKLR